MKILKCLLMIVTAPVVLVLTLFVWLCMGLIYISGLVLGLLSTVIALLGVAVLITYSPQNGAILLIMAFLISPMGLPLAAIWLLGKVQSLKFAIQDWVYSKRLIFYENERRSQNCRSRQHRRCASLFFFWNRVFYQCCNLAKKRLWNSSIRLLPFCRLSLLPSARALVFGAL